MSDPGPVPSDLEEQPDSLTGTVVRGASMSGLGFFLAQTMNLAVYMALTRLLTPHEFGVYAAGSILITFAFLGTDSGMVSAVIQRRDRVEEAANTALIATAAAGLLFGLLALAASPLMGLIFDSSEVTAVAAVMSGIVAIQTLNSVPSALLQRSFSFLRRLVIEPIQVVIFGVGAIVSASLGMGVWSLVIGQYAAIVGEVVLSWTLVRWRPRLRLASYAMWRELVHFGRYVLISGVLVAAGEEGTALIVGRFLGTSALGQFRNGYRLALMPWRMLVAAASYVLFPAFSRISHDAARLTPAFLRSLRWMSIAAFPAGLLLLPLGKSLTLVVLGDQWGAAGEVVAAMGMWAGAGAIIGVISEALKARGDSKLLLRLTCVKTPLLLLSMLAMVPLGLTAAAYGLALGQVLSACYALHLCGRVMDIHLRAVLAQIWAPLVAAGLMAIALLPVDRAIEPATHGTIVGLILVAAEIALGLAIYALLLRLFAPTSAREVVAGVRSRLERRRGRLVPESNRTVV